MLRKRVKLPANLRRKDTERFDPTKWGAPPPIRFIHTEPSDKEEGEVKKGEKVKISVSTDIKKVYYEFTGGDPEDFVHLN